MKGNKFKKIALSGGAYTAVVLILLAYFLYAFSMRTQFNGLAETMEEINNAVNIEAVTLTNKFEMVEATATFAASVIENGDVDIPEILATIEKTTLVDTAKYVSNNVAYYSNGEVVSTISADETASFVHDPDVYFDVTYPVSLNSSIVCYVKKTEVFKGFSDESFFLDSVIVSYEYASGNMILEGIGGGDGSSEFLNGDLDANIRSNLSGWSSLLSKIKENRQSYVQMECGSDERVVGVGTYFIKGEKHAIMVLTKQAYADKVYQSSTNAKLMKEIKIEIILCIIFLVIVYIAAIIMVVTHSSENRRELEGKADTDLLTGLSNKISTENMIASYIEANPHSQGVLILVDVDNFKKINDTMGHAFGDEVLAELGVRLKSLYRVSDIVGRIGGDEFLVFLKDINDREVIEREARKLETFFRGFEVGQYVKYSVTASLGAAIYSKDGTSFEELYRNADTALYTSKHHGKKQLSFYKQGEKAAEEDGEES